MSLTKYGQRRAVLISGGLDSFNNYQRFLNDLKIVYDCLVQVYRFAAQDVQVFFANGGTHDMGGRQVVTSYANKANVLAGLRKAVQGLRSDDLLVLVTSNHGRLANPHELVLWTPGEKLNAQELGQVLAGEPSYHFLGVFGECFGGDMFFYLQKALAAHRYVLVAASTGASWSLPPDDAYDAFLYFLTTALSKKTPSGYPVDVRQNKNIPVTLQEAFDHAKTMDQTQDQPDLAASPGAMASKLTLEGFLP